MIHRLRPLAVILISTGLFCGSGAGAQSLFDQLKEIGRQIGAPPQGSTALRQTGSAGESGAARAASPEVRAAMDLQADLNRLGFDAGPVDGRPGARTRNAVTAYQTSRGFAPTGNLTPLQRAALDTEAARVGGSADEQRRTQAFELQSYLSALGYDVGTPDGAWGPRSQAALDAFRQRRGMARVGSGPVESDRQSLFALAHAGPAQVAGAQVAPPVALNGQPSFDCARAGNATERAICADAGLAALDRDLDATWTAAFAATTGASDLRVQQSEWLATRNACGADTGCIADRMRSRIATLQAVASGQVVTGAPFTPVSEAATVAQTAPQPASSGVTSIDGLAAFNGRIVWPAQYLTDVTGFDLSAQRERLGRRLFFSGLTAGADDLATALAAPESLGLLMAPSTILPEETLARVRDDALDIIDADASVRSTCTDRSQGSYYWISCVSNFASAFEQRRINDRVLQEIVAIIPRQTLEVPTPVHVFCPIEAIDRAYDFTTNEVNWRKLLPDGHCSVVTSQLTGVFPSTWRVDAAFDMDTGVPATTPMDIAQAERLTQLTAPTSITRRDGQPLMVTFPARIFLSRIATSTTGFSPMSIRVVREGPVDLRWSGAPDDVLMAFDAPDPSDRPTSAIDLADHGAVTGLMASALPFDPENGADVVRAVLDGQSDPDAPLVRLNGYLQPVGTDRNGPMRIVVGNLRDHPITEGLANMIQTPGDMIAWNQVNGRNGAVEVISVFTRVRGALITDVVPNATETTLTDISLVARMEAHAVLGKGAFGPTLVTLLRPLHFEGQVRTPQGEPREVIQIPLIDQPAPDVTRVFRPSVHWLVAEAARLSGRDPAGIFEEWLRPLYFQDVFALQDAVDANSDLAAAELVQQDGRDTWIMGTLRLGPYSLDGQTYPIVSVRTLLPTVNKDAQAMAASVVPVMPVPFGLPLSEDRAREMRDTIKADVDYPFRARVTFGAPKSPGTLSMPVQVHELALLGPDNRPNIPSLGAAFLGGNELVSVAFRPRSAPTEPPPPRVEDTVTTPPASPAPMASGSGPWPDMSGIDVPLSDIDLLGVRTGQPVGEAHAILMARDGVLSVHETTGPDTTAQNLLDYQRTYLLREGQEAVTLYAPGPDAPVLAVVRRLVLNDGVLPYDQIGVALVEKYGQPTRLDSVTGIVAWGPPDAPLGCFPQARAMRDMVRFRQIPRLGQGATVDVTQYGAAAVGLFPMRPDDAASASCGAVVIYQPETLDMFDKSGFRVVLFDNVALASVVASLQASTPVVDMDIEF